VTTTAETLEAAVKGGAARALRQSLLNSADICLRRAQYDLNPPGPKRTSESAIIGTGYHAGLEHYYDWRMQEEMYGDADNAVVPPADVLVQANVAAHDTVVHEIEKYEPHLITWDTSPKRAIEIAQEMMKAYFEQAHYWGPEYVVLGTEVPFWLPSPYPGWVNHGTADLVLHGPDPCASADEIVESISYNGEDGTFGIIIDDHKTSSRKWDAKKHTVRKTAQVPTYFEAWQVMTGAYPLAFSFSIIQRNGTFERRLVRPTDDEMAAFKTKRDNVVQLLSLGVDLPGNTASNLCSSKYCSWWEQCPMGAAMGQ
jgi:hypothetical protein